MTYKELKQALDNNGWDFGISLQSKEEIHEHPQRYAAN